MDNTDKLFSIVSKKIASLKIFPSIPSKVLLPKVCAVYGTQYRLHKYLPMKRSHICKTSAQECIEGREKRENPINRI